MTQPENSHPTNWHPPGLQDGAMVYEANPDQNGDGNFGGEFYTTTTSGSVIVNPDGVLLIILPTSDPIVAGALWNDSGTIKASTGIG